MEHSNRVTRVPVGQWSSREVSEKYKALCLVGKGTYGEVWKAHELNDPDKFVALKLLKESDEKQGFGITSLREIKALRLIQHPNVVKLLDVATERPICQGKGSTYLVFEYVEHDLEGLMTKRVQFKDQQLRVLMRQFLEGLKAVHAQKIVHRDIKFDNLLYSNKGELKIGDFGLSKKLQVLNWRVTAKVQCITAIAPEMMFEWPNYNEKVDIWSAGIVFGRLLLNRHIFQSDSQHKLIDEIFQVMGTFDERDWPGIEKMPVYIEHKPKEPIRKSLRQIFFNQRSNISDDALDLLEHMLQIVPDKRWSAEQCLQHPYVQDIRIPEDLEMMPQFTSDLHKMSHDTQNDVKRKKPLTLNSINRENNPHNNSGANAASQNYYAKRSQPFDRRNNRNSNNINNNSSAQRNTAQQQQTASLTRVSQAPQQPPTGGENVAQAALPESVAMCIEQQPRPARKLSNDAGNKNRERSRYASRERARQAHKQRSLPLQNHTETVAMTRDFGSTSVTVPLSASLQYVHQSNIGGEHAKATPAFTPGTYVQPAAGLQEGTNYFYQAHELPGAKVTCQTTTSSTSQVHHQVPQTVNAGVVSGSTVPTASVTGQAHPEIVIHQHIYNNVMITPSAPIYQQHLTTRVQNSTGGVGASSDVQQQQVNHARIDAESQNSLADSLASTLPAVQHGYAHSGNELMQEIIQAGINIAAGSVATAHANRDAFVHQQGVEYEPNRARANEQHVKQKQNQEFTQQANDQ